MDNDIIPISSLKDDDVIPVNALKETNSETFLQQAIRAFTPQSKEEWRDIPSIAAQSIGISPLVENQLGGPFEFGTKLFGFNKNTPEEDLAKSVIEPKTDWGKELNNYVQIAQLAVPSSLAVKQGAVSGVRGINSIFKNPKLIREAISDLKDIGPSKIKAFVEDMLKEGGKEFGSKLAKAKGGISNKEFSEVLLNAAHDYGEPEVVGSAGNTLLKLSEEYSRFGNRVMKPSTAQANYRKVLEMLPDETSKSIFNNHYGSAVESFSPELSKARNLHSNYYDVAKASRKINKTNIGRASGTGAPLGKEGLSELVQAEQMMGPEAPNYIEQAVKLGDKLNRANSLKRFVSGIGKTAGLSAIGGTAANMGWNLLKFLQGQ
jgi:hypothetical protein